MRTPLVWAAVGLAIATATAAAAAGRTIVSLDGKWQIAQGRMDAMPPRFESTVPVPGLCDMAAPPFGEVGVKSAQREAFWYRRTFTLKGPRRSVALLKVNKAQFGTEVWVNGTRQGEHLACFTPGWFDISRLVRYDTPNTLVIRVGAYKDSVPATVPTNTDYEQVKWLPGIYDSVSLHLMDGPVIESVQVAPLVKDGTADVQLRLRGAGVSGKSPVRVSIREWKSGKPAAESWGTMAEADGTITAKIRLKSPRLWCPEDPFLYVARCETEGDSVETRFGMREFRYDAATGRAMLNGKPIFLRGTNFCIFRFFEDPVRGGLPWDRKWVRKLLEMGRRTFDWNAARVCIAPFPEFWYDIADEQGWLLDDEFPIWGFHDSWSQDELVTQFREWMQERWNHPSLVVWDACNETKTPRTGKLIASVRDLDLSNRPWDDGYSERHRPDDAMEDHPYRFSNPKFRLEDLGSPIGAKGGLLGPPVVLNEYGWLWLNRDGTPCTLTEQVYANNIGPNATPDQHREFYAYSLAALTEYWRARRQAAGVLHFCYLTYSRPGGQTSDHFLDVPNLVLEPRFTEYMRDAFSPLGVMIDDFTEQQPAGKRAYSVIVTNDLDSPQSGRIRLKVLEANEGYALRESSAPFEVDALGQTVVKVILDLPAGPGKYRVVAEADPATGRTVRSRRNITVVSAAEARRMTNIARGCAVTASSEITDSRGECRAAFATDGQTGTRWSSEFSDPQWLCVDLGASRRIGRVELAWEGAYGRAYRIQASDDGREWRDVFVQANGQGGREEITFSPVGARFVRFVGQKRATPYGYSLWELRVFEQ